MSYCDNIRTSNTTIQYKTKGHRVVTINTIFLCDSFVDHKIIEYNLAKAFIQFFFVSFIFLLPLNHKQNEHKSDIEN